MPGILALICSLVLLFGRRRTVKPFGWLAVLVVLGIGGVAAFLTWSEKQAKRAAADAYADVVRHAAIPVAILPSLPSGSSLKK
jgi:hypothetical protein